MDIMTSHDSLLPKPQASPAKSLKGKDLPALPSFGGLTNWADEVEESLAESTDAPSSSGGLLVEEVEAAQPAPPRPRNLKPAQSKKDILSQISKYIRPPTAAIAVEKPAAPPLSSTHDAPPAPPAPQPRTPSPPQPSEAAAPTVIIEESTSTSTNTQPPRAVSPPVGLSLMGSRWANAPDEETDEEEEKKTASARRNQQRKVVAAGKKSPLKAPQQQRVLENNNSSSSRSDSPRRPASTNTPSKSRTPRRGGRKTTPSKKGAAETADVFAGDEEGSKKEKKMKDQVIVVRAPPPVKEAAVPARKAEASPTRGSKESDSVDSGGFKSYAGVNEIMSSRWSS